MFKKQFLVRAREQLEVPNTNNSANDWPRAAAPNSDDSNGVAMPSSSIEKNMIRMNTAFAVPQFKENIAATTSINSNGKWHEETTASCTVTPDENDSGETASATHRLPLQQQEHNNALSNAQNPLHTTSCTATFQGESYPAMEVAAREELQRRTKKPQQHEETTTLDDSTSQEELAAAIALVGLSPQSSQSWKVNTKTTDLREVVRRITPDNAAAETSEHRDSKGQQQEQHASLPPTTTATKANPSKTIITPPIDDTIISITIHENARTTTQDGPINKTPMESKAIVAISDHSTIETKESFKANNSPPDVPPVRRHSDSTIETRESSKANNLPRIENVPPGLRRHYEADSTDESLEEHPQQNISTVLPKTTANIKDGATATKTDTSTTAKALEESLLVVPSKEQPPKHEENLASNENVTVVEIGKEPPAVLARSESKHVETLASNEKFTIVEIQNEPTALLARSESVVLSNEPPPKHKETLTPNENFTIVELRKEPTALEAHCDPKATECQAAREQSSKSSKTESPAVKPLLPKEPTNTKQAPAEEDSGKPCKKKTNDLLKNELSKLESHCGEGIHWAPVTGKRRRKSSSLCEVPTKKAASLHNSQLIGKRKRSSSLCDAPTETTLASYNTRSFDRKEQQLAPKGLQSYNREGSYWEPKQKHRKKPKLLLSSRTKRASAKTKKAATIVANTKTKRSREAARAKTAVNTSEISSHRSFSIMNDTNSKHHAAAATTPLRECKDDHNDKAKHEFLKLRWSSVVPIDGLEPKQWSSKKKLHSDEYLKSRWKSVVPLRSPTNLKSSLAEEDPNRTATKILYQEACSLEYCSPIRNIRAKRVPLPSSK